ncbi:NAD(P)/FAD-dependent oxidoreductase [Diaminobutyricimonas sp. TR449]|uniref:flavin monoamine oxidase family protein n=1 Tax=Diaminobutyricimonas sp. TR449 TaxID=2708076 RepID=UPI00142054F7|nr:NAD(P)/FAD-dependent oxidoreductase [Diaminobutyricimonas sp. TR449]
MPAIDRRTFLVGSASGLILFGLTACTGDTPTPTPSPTRSPEPSRVPTPTAFRRSAWSDDPFARGAISFMAVGSSPEDRQALAEPVDSRLFLAGEAASSFPGTVAGAILSGRRVAGQVSATAAQGDRIAVIGAGAAGLTAARALADQGFEVVVIEGRDRIGGRILTIGPNDDWPQPIELGASIVEAGSSLADQLTELGIATQPLPVAEAETRTVEGVVVEEPAVVPDALNSAVAWAAGQPRDLSVAEALEESGAGALGTSGDISDTAWLEHFLRTQLAVATGAEADRISAWYGTTGVTGVDEQAEEGQAAIVLGGFSTLIDSLAEGLDIAVSSPVSHVAEAEDGVSLRLGNGQTLTVERVVVTVPLGVLKAGTIEFDPPLPFRHREAIDALGVGALEVIWLRFDEPFWQTEAPIWRVVDAESDVAAWVNLEPFTGEPMLMGIVAADAAERMAELSDEEVRAMAQRSLDPFVDAATPEPEE